MGIVNSVKGKGYIIISNIFDYLVSPLNQQKDISHSNTYQKKSADMKWFKKF
jgi:hypothetical protein